LNFVNEDNQTALIVALKKYSINRNCDHNILLKMLDMNCIPEHIDRHGSTALMYAFKHYGSNPNCNSEIFHKLLDMNCIPDQIDNLDITARTLIVIRLFFINCLI
jgi:hypothetical protein